MVRIVLLVCCLGCVAPWPVAAQPVARIPRIGFLCLIPCSGSPVQEGLRELGYLDGKNAVFEVRSADGVAERLPQLAADLVKLKVDVIVAQHGLPAAEAAKRATATIPIVFTSVGDPVAFGLLPSLAKPGANLTGIAFLAPELSRKQVEFLKEAVPSLSRVTFLRAPDNPADVRLARERKAAAQALGLELQEIDVRTLADIESAFAAAAEARSNAIYLSFDSVMFRHEKRIVELLSRYSFPAMAPARDFVADGALMAFGPNFSVLNRRAAIYVDKILKGAKPGDLPVEQPTKFELVVNLETAKALGLAIPRDLLLRADEVIR
jgi:putative tryptophan/tyrosine transport system substrate-binding protein